MSFEYIAILPHEIHEGDRIILRGTTRENAEQFTIDFANATCPNPPNIALSLQIVPQKSTLILTYKQNNEWNLYKESTTYTLDGNNFDLMLGFANDTISIYSGGNSFIDAISPENGLSDIKSLQVGGDVEKIRELTFLYDTTL